MSAVTAIFKMIGLAPINQTGTVPWTGENGLEAILTNVAGKLKDGVLFCPDISSLIAIGPSDGNWALVANDGLYYMNLGGFPGNFSTTFYPGNGGGYWNLVTTLPATTPYTKNVGNGSLTSFDIAHGLNTLTPIVDVFDVTNGLPYPRVSTEEYSVSITNTNELNVQFVSAPGFNDMLIAAHK